MGIVVIEEPEWIVGAIEVIEDPEFRGRAYSRSVINIPGPMKTYWGFGMVLK